MSYEDAPPSSWEKFWDRHIEGHSGRETVMAWMMGLGVLVCGVLFVVFVILWLSGSFGSGCVREYPGDACAQEYEY
jgi:hypothetical protein